MQSHASPASASASAPDAAASGASAADRPDPAGQARRRRLLFRATHRGTHETDLLIGGFVAANLDAFTEPELDALEEVIELPDPDLADWLTGRRPVPAECDSPMLRRMLAAAAAPASERRRP